MLAADYPFLDLMWTMLIFFLWIAWFWILFTQLLDRDAITPAEFDALTEEALA